MQHLKSLLFCLALALLVSCVNERVINRGTLESNTDSLCLIQINTEPLSGTVLGIFCTEDYLVFSLQNPEFCFAALPLSFDRTPFYFGRIGRGPGEMIHPDFKSIQTSVGNSFSVFDSGRFKTVSLADGEAVVTISEEELGISGPFNGMQRFGDGHIDIDINMQEGSSDYEFVRYDADGEISTFLSKYPNWAGESENKLFCYIKNFVTSDDGRFLASFYGHFPCARFIDETNNRIHTVRLDLPQESGDVLSRRCYVGRPFVDGDSVSALYQTEKNSEVHKWTWDGSFISRTVLSQRVSFFCYSPDRKRLFAWAGDTEQLYTSYARAD